MKPKKLSFYVIIVIFGVCFGLHEPARGPGAARLNLNKIARANTSEYSTDFALSALSSYILTSFNNALLLLQLCHGRHEETRDPLTLAAAFNSLNSHNSTKMPYATYLPLYETNTPALSPVILHYPTSRVLSDVSRR
ncbi:hypothetical protein B0J13DRAFT_681843 [Dactylonectria estremocensis]|uniref:Uncharacterized protein n=1 Tax=Dactylonectria estremocensis TaxID=1079267 RepID=A0A9P9D5B9_9HYPO|nr:hypothetical protein B0J13DRAFT_681843 [Dactylonectria estremocensis]